MDNKCLSLGNYKAKQASVKIRVTKNNSLLKQKYFNKKARTISDLYFFNLENQENDILKKIENISHDNKKKRELSINSTNGIKLEGIQNKNNNMNYFNNINIINNNSISKPDKNVDKYNIISFPKFMEYTPNFEQNNNIIFPNDNKNINSIKNDINNNNNINNSFKKINNNNTNKNTNNRSTKFKLNYKNNIKNKNAIGINNLTNNLKRKLNNFFSINIFKKSNLSKKQNFNLTTNDFEKNGLNMINNNEKNVNNKNKKNDNKHRKYFTDTFNNQTEYSGY